MYKQDWSLYCQSIHTIIVSLLRCYTVTPFRPKLLKFSYEGEAIWTKKIKIENSFYLINGLYIFTKLFYASTGNSMSHQYYLNNFIK